MALSHKILSAYPGSAARTSSVCVSGLTFRMTLATFPSGVDDEGGALVAPVRLAGVVLLDPDAVLVGDLRGRCPRAA